MIVAESVLLWILCMAVCRAGRDGFWREISPWLDGALLVTTCSALALLGYLVGAFIIGDFS